MIFVTVLKWIGATALAILLIIAIATGLNLIVEKTCFQETSEIIISKFGPGGYFWKGN